MRRMRETLARLAGAQDQERAEQERAEAEVSAALSALRGQEALIGLDVDGTLVDHDGRMSERVHRALTAASRHHRIVIATGRSLGATLPIVQAAGIERGYAVASNGGVVIELDPEASDGFRVIQTRTFRPGAAMRALKEAAPNVRCAVELPDGTFRSTGSFQDNSFGVRAEPTPFEELLELDAVRVVVQEPELGPEEFSRIVEGAGVHGVSYAIGWSAWLDMAAPGVSKATALESIRERLGISSAWTVAAGDGLNDVEMLRWAAVGVAMGQARPEVVDAADARTAGVDQDGAALVLETLMR